MRVGVALQGSIVLRAVTIYRPETQTDNLKLTFANSSLFSDFLSLECHVCLSFVIKMRKMTKLRQKLHISWLIYRVFHRIHIVDGFYLQLKIIMVWNISQCTGVGVSKHLLW